MQTKSLLLFLPFLLLPACGGGGSGGGGGGGGNAVANLAAIGMTPRDLTDIAGVTMSTSVGWAVDDFAIPSLGPGCPSYVQGDDNDTSGHPDTLEVVFDCTDAEEDLTVNGSLFLSEYADPAQILGTLSPDCIERLDVAEMGAPSWGMGGSAFMSGSQSGGPLFSIQLGVNFAEFPAANVVLVEVTFTVPNYPTKGGPILDIGGTACFTLPADDLSDVPVGYIDSFFFDGDPPAVLSLECELLTNGTVAFEGWGAGDFLIASGTFDLAADVDDDEVVFD